MRFNLKSFELKASPRIWLLRGAVGFLVFALAYYGVLLVQVWWLRGHNPEMTAFMEQGLERLRAENPQARLQYEWISYDRISIHLKRAVLAAEDQKFLTHRGFDWEEVEKAMDKNEAQQKVVRGASTVSQQLAKNLFLSARRTYWRKAQEAIVTVMLERLLTKGRIYEIYLNVIEWGNGVYGAEAAARHYYNKSAAALSASEAARLAVMIPNPRLYDRRRETPYLGQRTEFVLKQMHTVAVP